MSQERKSSGKLKTIVFLSLFALTVIALAAFAVSRRQVQVPQAQAAAGKVADADRSGYVNRMRLRPQLRDAIRVLGDRLEKPGKERLILTGQLSRDQGEKQNVRLILEYPDKLRLEEASGVTVFDGKDLKSSKAKLSKKEEDEIESLLSDSVEHFFEGQSNGQATRFLGSRFRMDDGLAQNYRGPFYEVYFVNDQAKVKKEKGAQPKEYYLNSDSLLLERIRYEAQDTKAKFEVQFSDWQKFDDQLIPRRITKLENGTPTLSLTISSVATGARQSDTIFSQP